MNCAEIISESDNGKRKPRPWRQKTNRDEIERVLRKNNYKRLGAGADASIWTKDVGTVIKIIVPESDDTASEAINTFKKFYEFCMQHQDIECLPKFIQIQGKHYTEFTINGKTYLQIAMEQLYPLQKNSFEEGVVWFFSSFVSNYASWKEVNILLKTSKEWSNYDIGLSEKLANRWKQLTDKERMRLKLLYSVMQLLYQSGKINKFGWDLHTENVMKRRDGTLVIIDPWFSINN